MTKRNGFALTTLLSIAVAQAQEIPLYKRADAPVEQRVADLLSRMTLEEKFWQLFMVPGDVSHGMEKYSHGIFGLTMRDRTEPKQAADQMLDYADTAAAREAAERTNAVQKYFIERTRLGIPIVPFDEALHGLVRADATSFPQSIGLAATWDVPLVGSVASAIAREARTRGVRDVLSPVINIARDVRWGRVEETYGEDPFLCARIAAAYTGSFTRQGVITTPKHMIANSGDGGRDSYPIDMNERLLNEQDFQPYLACIREGGTTSVMTSYNSLNGEPCTSNTWLLRTILKGKWGFDGFVISDASAVGGLLDLHHIVHNREESAKRAIEGGVDVIFQSDYDHHVPLLQAFKDGLVDTSAMNDAVTRVLRAKFRLGLFEQPYADPDEAARWNGNLEHRALALEAARESIVLLKNEGHALPWRRDLHSLAVIGEDAVEARLGGYSGPGIHKVSILDGITKKLGPGTIVRFSPGCGRLDTAMVAIPSNCLRPPEGGRGLQAEYFNNISLEGMPVVKRIDANVDFKWSLFSPDPLINADWFSGRWTGRIECPESGTFRIGVNGDEGYRLFLDGRLIIDTWEKHGHGSAAVPFAFVKGTSHAVRLEFKACVDNIETHLMWDVGIRDHRKAIREAVAVAKSCDAIVIVPGIEEGEFRDRANIGLPGRQAEMIQQIAALGKPVAVVLIGGSAVTMDPWIDAVPALIDAWYPGEEGGTAVAEVLFGEYNPGGRLPITFPKSVAQLPLVYNHKPTGRGDDYYDMTGKPAYPFGFGLSYTTFAYDSLRITPSEIHPDGTTKVFFIVRNIGHVAGDEVVQLYVKDLVSTTVTPVQALKGFQRVHLLPGASTEVLLELSSDQLSILNEKMERVVEPGEFRIMIGSSSRDIRLRGSVQVSDR